MSVKTMDVRIVPPIVEFKDCDVGKPLKRTVKVINFGKVSREVRFLPKVSKVEYNTSTSSKLTVIFFRKTGVSVHICKSHVKWI